MLLIVLIAMIANWRYWDFENFVLAVLISPILGLLIICEFMDKHMRL